MDNAFILSLTLPPPTDCAFKFRLMKLSRNAQRVIFKLNRDTQSAIHLYELTTSDHTIARVGAQFEIKARVQNSLFNQIAIAELD
jgi:hypothetical protein